MDAKVIKEIIEKNWNVAKETLGDSGKLKELLNNLETKIKDMPDIEVIIADLPILISMIRSYLKKEYTEVPLTTLISIVAALIYVISPFDLIPDNLPFGLAEDALLVGFVVGSIHEDIENYRRWRDAKQQ